MSSQARNRLRLIALGNSLPAASAPVIGLAIVTALFGFLVPGQFLTLLNFKMVAVQTLIWSIAALGATAVIIAGGIDLSPGSTAALSAVVLAWMIKAEVSPTLAISSCILAGLACGVFNGAIVVALRLAPFIVTLGTMGILRGLAGLLARNNAIQVSPGDLDQVAPWLQAMVRPIPQPSWWIVAPAVWCVPILALAISLFLRRTSPGRYVFATGSNETAARLCGVPVGAVKIMVYALAGLTSGLAGIMLFARTGVGDPSAAEGMELNVIAAVVIGGASLRGGRGSILGTLLGAFLMALLQSGCTKAGLDVQIQKIIVGTIIITAAALDRIRNTKD